MKHIGDVIRLIREKKGITAKKLSLDAQIDAGYLSRIENGKSRMSTAILDSIAGALGLKAWQLWKGAEFYDEHIAPKIVEIMNNFQNDS